MCIMGKGLTAKMAFLKKMQLKNWVAKFNYICHQPEQVYPAFYCFFYFFVATVDTKLKYFDTGVVN